jgi:hypothetical protein
MQLLNELQPAYFFAAHLHVRFEAHVQHAQSDNGRPQRTTRFLALDKVRDHVWIVLLLFIVL